MTFLTHVIDIKSFSLENDVVLVHAGTGTFREHHFDLTFAAPHCIRQPLFCGATGTASRCEAFEKCAICHGEDVELKEVREEITAGNDVVLVPIKVLACSTCGERYYDRRTMKFFEEVEAQIKSGKSRLVEIGKVLEYR